MSVVPFRKPAELTWLGAAGIFAELPPAQWLIPGLFIAPGPPTLIAGYGYSGKTIVAQSIALAVASGTPLWGLHPVSRGLVRHVDCEQGQRLTRRRYQRLAHHAGIHHSELEGYLELCSLPGEPFEQCDLSALSDGVSLVIIDSWRAAHKRVDENSSEVRGTLDRMAVASERTGAAFLLIHHAKKKQQQGKGGDSSAEERFQIRGSSGFVDGPQTIYVLDGTEVGAPVMHLVKERVLGSRMAPVTLSIRDHDEGAGLSVEALAPPPRAGKRDLEAEALRMLPPKGTIGIPLRQIREVLKCKMSDLVDILKNSHAAMKGEDGHWYRV